MGMFTESNSEDYYFALKALEEKYKTLEKNYITRGETLTKAYTVITELKKTKESTEVHINALLNIQDILKNLNLGN